jgi:hypothetical protein
MTTLIDIFVAIHLLGFGALFGGLLVQGRDGVVKVNGAMRDGIGTAVVSGLVLFGLDSAHYHPDGNWMVKITVMLVIGVVILALVMINLRKEISRNLWGLLLLLTIVNVGVAVIWRA